MTQVTPVEMTRSRAVTSARTSGIRRLSRRSVRMFTWLGIAGVAFAFAARAFRWEAAPIPHLVALVPWLTLAVLLGAGATAVARSWVAAGAAGALALVGIAWLVPLYTAQGATGEPVLNVATVNLRFGHGDADEVVALIRDQHVDVISVQELTAESIVALRAAGIDELLPYSELHPDDSYGGTGLWSKLPMADAELVHGLVFNTVRARVETAAGGVTVYAVHPPRPEVGAAERWVEEQDKLRAALADTPGAVIVAGDFNTTLDHGPLRELEAAGFVSAIDQAGAGFLPTYDGGFPFELVAIDHVFTRGIDLVATDVDSFTIHGSDHRALVVAFSVG